MATVFRGVKLDEVDAKTVRLLSFLDVFVALGPFRCPDLAGGTNAQTRLPENGNLFGGLQSLVDFVWRKYFHFNFMAVFNQSFL